MNKKVFVIGSVTVDHVFYTDTMPNPGMTIKANSFFRNFGGKGANQAIAASNLGADVFFYGAIGNDDEGAFVSHSLIKYGMEGKYELKKSDQNTGVASITINNATGENQILIVQGANLDINKSDLLKLEKHFKESDIFLTQLENSYETTEVSIKMAKSYGLMTILNPAPYMEIKDDLFSYIDYFVPNEHEMDQFVPGDMSYIEKAKVILSKGCKNVIVTLGEKGSLLVNKDKVIKIEPFKVKAIDTTAAGDSYIGALVAALSKGENIEKSMQFASNCSSITVTRRGAADSLPTLKEVQ